MLAPYIAQVGNPEQLTLKFRFQINGTDDPDFIVPGGCVTDVTQESTGVFKITFAQKYPVFVGLVGTVLEATPVNDLIVKADVADYDSSAGTLLVSVVGALHDAAAAEDPVDDDWVYLEVTFCTRSTLSPAVAI
jgi:hypothetical protein